jgi:hypothetical protein
VRKGHGELGVSTADAMGSIGVALLLLAFGLNLLGWTERNSAGYQALNALGAGLATSASYLIGFAPFVVLEGIWCFVSVLALVQSAPRHSAGPQ